MCGRSYNQAVLLAFLLPLGGCAVAPSLYLVGAYFPAWMLSALLGIVAAIVARFTFLSTGLAAEVPYQLLVNTAVGVTAGLLSWLMLFGW